MKKLGLYWWNLEPNFGDTISREVVAYASGRQVDWAPAADCDLFAVGSVLVFARRAHSTRRQGDLPWVWGSGCIGPIRRDFTANVRFASLRGPLSMEVLKIEVDSFGDPGLLAPEILGDRPARTDRIGLVIHHKVLADHWRDELMPRDPNTVLIDVRNPDHMAVVREIAACRLVISSSLHGLVVADAFGIPNIWLNPRGNHANSRFKFYDYANSIGRPMRQPVELRDLDAAIADYDDDELTYWPGVEATRSDILASFPEALKS